MWQLSTTIAPITVGYSLQGWSSNEKQEGQHPLTGQRAANFRLLAN